MKKCLVLAALAAATLCSAPAIAADQSRPNRAPTNIGYHGPAPYSWDGFYVGVQAGGSRSLADATATSGGFSGSGSVSESGWNAGAYAGYNFQYGNFVFGPEVELGTGKGMPIGGAVRGRLGYLLTDRFLAYGAVGWQMSRVNFDSGIGSWSENRSGWNLGAGGEYAITPKWHARVEYVYADLGTASSDVGAFHTTIGLRSHTVRAGLSYRF